MLTIACRVPANIDQLRDAAVLTSFGHKVLSRRQQTHQCSSSYLFHLLTLVRQKFQHVWDDNLQLVCIACFGQSAQTTNGSHSFSLVLIASRLGNWDDCLDHIGAGEMEGIPFSWPFPSICNGFQGHFLHWSWSFLNQLHQQVRSTHLCQQVMDGTVTSTDQLSHGWGSRHRSPGGWGRQARGQETDKIVSIYKLFQLIWM